MKKLLKFIPAGSAVLGITTLASYILGLLRDRIFAQTYGASQALDAYNAAFLLPDLLFNFLIASGIAAAVVPIFTEIYGQDKKKANEYANSIITAAMGMMLTTSILIIIFADSISNVVAPGLSQSGHEMVKNVTRVLAVSPILFGISNTLGAILIAKKRFLFYGLSPIFYNLGIICGTIFLSPHFGPVGTAIGTVIGAFAHLFIRLADSIRSGLDLKINFEFKTREFKKTIKLMLPKMFGHPVELGMFWGFTVIASGLQSGSVAIMNFARNFQSVPVSIIGITISTAVFPEMAKAVINNSREEFNKSLKNSFILITLGSTIAALFIFLIREPLIRLVLGGGNFDESAIKDTATTLGYFTLAMPTESLRHLFSRAYYATKNTAIPVLINIIGLAIAIGAGYALTPQLDILAIPISFSIASLVELVLMIAFLPKRLKKVYPTIHPIIEKTA